MVLNHRELMCVYFGYCANADMLESEKTEALKLTSEMLGISSRDFIELQEEALKGMEEVNTVMNNMLRKLQQGENPFNKESDSEKWR